MRQLIKYRFGDDLNVSALRALGVGRRFGKADEPPAPPRAEREASVFPIALHDLGNRPAREDIGVDLDNVGIAGQVENVQQSLPAAAARRSPGVNRRDVDDCRRSEMVLQYIASPLRQASVVDDADASFADLRIHRLDRD